PTLVLLVADAVLGTWLFRREGRKAWQALREAINARRVPAKEVADGALVVVGGAFLLSPGFVTDAVGVLCLLPPTRAVLRRALTGLVGRRLLRG
ncbi:MAG: FxsA family protein, partial [Actinomycetota bacterium]|nr:FxsA family protein [Actinomycetota bacterium]